jgi:hypothetical protein
MKLSYAQLVALRRLTKYAVVYHHEQIAITTAQALVNRGVAAWSEAPHWAINYGLIGKRRYVRRWSLHITAAGREMLASCKEY